MAKNQRSTNLMSGVARPASTVLMAPVRALSSHARRRYHERYLGRYRFAPLLFAFDTFLAGVAVSLVFVNIFLWWMAKVPTVQLEASIYAPALITSKTIPVEVVIAGTDGKTHRDVRLNWNLPSSVEVVEFNPKPDFFGRVHLGDVLPMSEVRALAHIRVHAQVGEVIPLRIQLSEGIWGNVIEGKQLRAVESGLIQTDSALSAKSVLPGASIPLRIKNTGAEAVNQVTLRLIRMEGAEAELGQYQSVTISRLEANSEQVIALKLGKELAKTIRATWQLEQAGRVIERKTMEWQKSDQVMPDIRVQSGSSSESVIVSSSVAAKLRTSKGEVSLTPGKNTVPWSVQAEQGTGFILLESSETLAPAIELPVMVRVPVSAEVRYYSASGDQIGIGPHPPAVGEETTYWAFWRVGPAKQVIPSAQFNLELAPNVFRTGSFAAPSGGTVSQQGKQTIWRISDLAPGAIAEYGMEIGIKPEAGELVLPLLLMNTSTFSMQGYTQAIPPLDTRLQGDEKANK